MSNVHAAGARMPHQQYYLPMQDCWHGMDYGLRNKGTSRESSDKYDKPNLTLLD